MAVQRQLRRGTTTENDNFTGAQGELSYDTQRKEVRIHDGSTVGGKLLGPFDVDYVTPDYSSRISVADNQDVTATHSGIFFVHFVRNATGGGTCTVRINNADTVYSSNDYADQYVFMPVKKGDVIYTTWSAISGIEQWIWPYRKQA